MILAEKREVLKEIIEHADEKLMALMIALANEYNEVEHGYSQQEIDGFIKIRDEMLARPENTFTPEQAHELIRNKKQ